MFKLSDSQCLKVIKREALSIRRNKNNRSMNNISKAFKRNVFSKLWIQKKMLGGTDKNNYVCLQVVLDLKPSIQGLFKIAIALKKTWSSRL